MLTKLVSVDLRVPTLDEGLALYCGALELAQLTDIVEEKDHRWVTLGAGGRSCVRLIQATGSGWLADRVKTLGYGFEQLDFLAHDIVGLARTAAGAGLAVQSFDEAGVLQSAAGPESTIVFTAFGTRIEARRDDRTVRHARGTDATKTGLFVLMPTADVSVPSIEDALALYCDRFRMTQLTDILGGRKGYLRMCVAGIGTTSVLGVLQPTGPGPMQRRVEQAGYGFHQLSFISDDVPGVIRALRGRGLNVIIERADWGDQPNEPGPDTEEGFVHPRSAFGVLVEFYTKKSFEEQQHAPRSRAATVVSSPSR